MLESKSLKEEESLNNKMIKDLEDYYKEQEGLTYKMQNIDKKLSIQSTLLQGKNSKYGLISITDVTKVQMYEQQRVSDMFKTMFL